MNNEWITTSKAAEISGYHPETIRELLREGKIEGRKFGPVWQVNADSLLEYVKTMEELGERRGPKSDR
jgi:excisionase family DNA binding protein